MKRIYMLGLAATLSVAAVAETKTFEGFHPETTPVAKQGAISERAINSHGMQFQPIKSKRVKARKADAIGQPIFTPPTAPKLYYRNVFGTYIESGFMSFHYGVKDAGFIAEDAEGNLYIKDIVSMSDFFSYAKLTPAGEGRYELKTPQTLYIDNFDGMELTYELMVMDKWVDPDDGTVVYEPSEETDVAVFNLTEDGKLVYETPYRFDEEQQDTGMPDRVLGVQLSYVEDDELISGWNAYSMMTSIFTPCDEQPNAAMLPAGMQTEEWALTYDGQSVKRNGHFVPVGVDGNDLWIGNLYPGADMWIKGTIEGDKVKFTGPQFMNTFYEFFQYFIPARRIVGTNDYGEKTTTFEYTDELVLDYDATKKTLGITHPDDIILMTWDPEVKGAADYWESPAMACQNEPKGVPMTPLDYFYEKEYDKGLDSWTFFVTPVSTDDYLYKDEDLFLRMYCNDEQITFLQDDYERLPEDMKDVPYLFDDRWDFFVSGLARIFAIYTYNLGDIETMAVSLCHRDPKTGVVTESEPLVYDYEKEEIRPAGIKTVESGAEVKAVTYYDLKGVRVVNPVKGLYIKKSITTDGNVKAEKVIL